MWDIVKSGKSYSGKIKKQTKNRDEFYNKLTLIPVNNNLSAEIESYIAIGFLTTEEENEKREMMQKVRKNIIQQKSKEANLKKEIISLRQDNMATKKEQSTANSNTSYLRDSIELEKKRNVKMVEQIKYYESEVGILSNKIDSLVAGEREKRKELFAKNKELSGSNKDLTFKIISLQNKLSNMES